MKYKIEISYNGTNFHGFQKQPQKRTVQGEIEKVFNHLFTVYDLAYAGRTDAGVHAKGQVLSLSIEEELDKKFLTSFNSIISKEIRMNKIKKINKNFAPRFDAKSRVYKYFIMDETRELPFLNDQVFFYNKDLNLEDLNKISKIFLGENNFTNFSKLRLNQFPKRNISHSKWSYQNSMYIYTIEGNSFLHNMVRSIVGCQLAIYEHKISIEDMKLSLKNPKDDRHRFMVPSCGLYLWKIKY